MANSNREKYCLDTNAVSDLLRERPDMLKNFGRATQGNCPIFIPSIVYYELTRGFKAAKSYRKLQEFLGFYSSFPSLAWEIGSMAVLDKAADIYAQLHRGQQIEDNDIYIAAIAMANDCTLVTANTRHFGRIAGLKITNWREL